MKFCLPFAGFIAICLFIACKKDDSVPNGDKTKLLSKYTSSRYLDTVSFGYNTSGQLLRSENNEDRSTFELSGSQLKFTEFRKTENRTTANATFTLNAQGNVVSGEGSFSYVPSSPYTAQFTFQYDGAGNLIKRTDTRSDGTVWSYEYTWTNGDITKIKWIYNGSLYLTINVSYYPDLEDKIKLDWDKFLAGTNSFLGNSNKHLRKHSEVVFAPGTTITQEYNFVYNLDADGYPTTSTSTGVTTPSTDLITYYYE